MGDINSEFVEQPELGDVLHPFSGGRAPHRVGHGHCGPRDGVVGSTFQRGDEHTSVFDNLSRKLCRRASKE